MRPRDLTQAQHDAVLQLGNRSEGATMTLAVYRELLELGILRLGADGGQPELTKQGRTLYDELVWELAT